MQCYSLCQIEMLETQGDKLDKVQVIIKDDQDGTDVSPEEAAEALKKAGAQELAADTGLPIQSLTEDSAPSSAYKVQPVAQGVMLVIISMLIQL